MSPDRTKAVAQFRITADEYAEGVRALMAAQPSFLAGPLTGTILLVAGMVEAAGVLVGLGILVLTMAAVMWRVMPYARFKKTPQLADEQTHTFTEDGLVVHAGGRSGKLTWEFYTMAKETPRVYLLMRNAKQANFIPKRAFHSPEDEERFRAMAAARLRTSWP